MSLRERREIMKLAAAMDGGGVLFTLVRVAGSSYRQAGARLLVLPDGRTAGTLSGGCLEGDIVRRAQWTVRSGAVVERFSTAFDDTSELPYGLGCGGEVDVLAEPLDTPEADAMISALDATVRGEPRIVATPLPLQAATLARAIFDGNGETIFASTSLSAEMLNSLRSAALHTTGCGTHVCDGVDVFMEHMVPAQRLIIFGAGEDARPLVRVAAEMGWNVVVADTRESRLTTDRFPSAQTLVHAAQAMQVPVQPDDAVVVMTHSYEQDRRLVAEMLPLQPRYLGLLGARHRSALLLQEAAHVAGIPLRTAIECTHAPVGIHLGGDGPEAVALSIVAEVQSALSGVAASSRRMSPAEAEQLLERGPRLLPQRDTCGLTVTGQSPEREVAS